MTDQPVRLLLDTSAIVAYTRHSIHVGEVIAEVADEEAAVGLPVLCLVEANRVTADAGLLGFLVAHQATTVMPVAADTWRALTVIYDSAEPARSRRRRARRGQGRLPHPDRAAGAVRRTRRRRARHPDPVRVTGHRRSHPRSN